MPSLFDHINEKWSHLTDHTLYVACSGGLDSMVLLDLLRKCKMNIRVIHVNYQLRGEDSDLDEKHVSDYCKNHEIPFECRRVNLSDRKGSTQLLAREIRYDWFHEILASDRSHRILLAHHADDQVETFFLNLARKSGVMGLSCMPTERDGIIRPLLSFAKSELTDYAEEHQIHWREDVSNISNLYRRNLLRNIVLPELRSEVQGIDESVLILIDAFQQEQIRLEEQVAPIYSHILNEHCVSLSRLEELSDHAKVELLRQLGQSPRRLTDFDQLISGKKGAQMELSSPVFDRIVRDREQLSFIGHQKRRYELRVDQIRTLPDVFSKDVIYLDKSLVKGNLHLRPWQKGDRIAPLGMSGTQLISKTIKESGISANDKEGVHVLCDSYHVHWCVGLKIGRHAVANDHSKEILACSVISITEE